MGGVNIYIYTYINIFPNVGSVRPCTSMVVKLVYFLVIIDIFFVCIFQYFNVFCELSILKFLCCTLPGDTYV